MGRGYAGDLESEFRKRQPMVFRSAGAWMRRTSNCAAKGAISIALLMTPFTETKRASAFCNHGRDPSGARIEDATRFGPPTRGAQHPDEPGSTKNCPIQTGSMRPNCESQAIYCSSWLIAESNAS
jgi:hypothetical protein